MTIRQLPHGFVATQSPDGRFTYIHVLRAPASGDTITLPSPLDGKTFGEAVLLPSGKAARLTQDDNGVTLTLPSGEGWDSLDTVFRLTTASVPEQTPVEETLYTGPILATASDADGSHGAEQALDPDLTTFWGVAAPFKTPDGADKYLQLDLGSVQRVTGLILTPRRDSIRRATLQFHLSSYKASPHNCVCGLRPEIHTVFPPFYNFRMRQNLWPNALAKLCGAAITFWPARQRKASAQSTPESCPRPSTPRRFPSRRFLPGISASPCRRGGTSSTATTRSMRITPMPPLAVCR